jgi:hypothetical protein
VNAPGEPAQPLTSVEHASALHPAELNVVEQPLTGPVVQGVHVPLAHELHWPVHVESQHTFKVAETDTQLPVTQSKPLTHVMPLASCATHEPALLHTLPPMQPVDVVPVKHMLLNVTEAVVAPNTHTLGLTHVLLPHATPVDTVLIAEQ